MQVRGIECDAWLSTGSISNYGWWNLTYYFVASDWSNPSHMAIGSTLNWPHFHL